MKQTKTVIKKYIMPEKEREIFCSMVRTIEFKYTISRAPETYGSNACSLWLNSNKKVARCVRPGNDMYGICLGIFIREYFPEQLKQMKSSEFFGLRFYNEQEKKAHTNYQPGDKICVDGECGFAAMGKILCRIGFFLDNPIDTNANDRLYQLKYFSGEYGKFKELSLWGLLFS